MFMKQFYICLFIFIKTKGIFLKFPSKYFYVYLIYKFSIFSILAILLSNFAKATDKVSSKRIGI